MKLGEVRPITEPPPVGRGRPGRWDGMWDAVMKLSEGQELPIQCETVQEAKQVQHSVIARMRSRKNLRGCIRMRKRGLTITVMRVRAAVEEANVVPLRSEESER